MQKFNKILTATLVIFSVLGLTGPIIVSAATDPGLGTTLSGFSVLSQAGITGTATISGNVGENSTGASITALTSGMVTGTIYSTDGTGPSVASPFLDSAVQASASTAFTTQIPGQTTSGTIVGALDGQTFTTGVYDQDAITLGGGTVTLNGPGIYIFRSASTLTSSGTVSLTNGARACDVYWRVQTSAAINGSGFVGTILSGTTIAFGANVTLNGRAFGVGPAAAVTFITDTISGPTCAVPVAGTCGTAATSYLSTDTAFAGTMCGLGSGITTPASPVFPTAGNSVTWTCGGSDFGASSSTCTATRASAPASVAGTCGTAATSYLSTDTAFAGTMCGLGSGITTPASPVFPTAGNSVTWTCGGSNGGASSSICTATRAAASITVVAPQLTVTKIVVGGSKVISDFPLFIDGVSATSGLVNTTTVGVHTVSETSNSSYTSVIGGACAANGTITLASGDVKVCTITNTYIQPPSSTTPGGHSDVVLIPPLISVVKVPSPLALPAGPGSVLYTYTVHNIGTVPMTNVTMVGDTCSPIVLISGDTNGDSKLDLTETWTYTCSTTLTATHTNTVTATGWANGISAIDIANATVVVGVPIIPPIINVTKVPSPLALLAGGGIVTYTEKVTNPGTAPLSNVRLFDDKCIPVQYVSGDTNSNSKLDPSETWTYTCRTNLINTTTNTVTATGQANGLTATDFAIATVVVAAPALPSTGFPPKENNLLLNILVAAGALMLVSTSIVVFLKKREI